MGQELVRTACAGCGTQKDGAGKYCVLCYSKRTVHCPDCMRKDGRDRWRCKNKKKKCERCQGTRWVEV
jgi:hypothetical protein